MKYLMLSFLCVLLLLSACEIKEFSLPVWDVDIQIPLINDRYYVSELVDSVHIVTDQNEILQLVSTGELTSEEIFSVKMTPEIDLNDLPILAGENTQLKLPLQDSEENVRLSYGQILSGSLRYRFSSVADDVQAIVLRFEDIRNASGEVIQVSYVAQEWVELDLTGYSFGSLNSMEILDSLQVNISITSEHPAGTPIADFSLHIDETLHFSTFQGTINHLEITAPDPSASLDIDYPFGIDQAVTLSEASIIINITNEVGFSCEFSGWFEARKDAQVVRVPILDDNGENYRIPAAIGDTPGMISLVIHDNISDLMQIMPHHIELVEASFVIDSISGFGSLSTSDEITADYLVQAPFRFTLHEYPIEVQNAVAITISEDNREQIKKNLMEAALQMQVRNMIPIGGEAFAYFGSSEDIDTSDPATYAFVKSVAIESGASNDGWQQMSSLALSRDELLFFTESDIYLKWVFSFMESNGEVVITATSSDYIALKGSITARIRVED